MGGGHISFAATTNRLDRAATTGHVGRSLKGIIDFFVNQEAILVLVTQVELFPKRFTYFRFFKPPVLVGVFPLQQCEFQYAVGIAVTLYARRPIAARCKEAIASDLPFRNLLSVLPQKSSRVWSACVQRYGRRRSPV